MRFSLQDVRKTVQRRGGDLSVSLHFLHSGELHTEIARLIAYYESFLDEPQRSFSLDDARACIGDYRTANCLIATLSNWYNWQSLDWISVVQSMEATADLLALASSVQLRLALYDYVNAHFHGFLSVQHRDEALQAFAAQFQLAPRDLEYLLVLDSEEEAVLTRMSFQPPDPEEVALLYNQWVFEAALFNASSVRFVIDCAAFTAGQTSADRSGRVFTPTGVGSVIKRLGYLARKVGVYYDLEYTSLEGDEPAPQPLLALTLYGPQDVTGAPQQYGLRLARLCRMLLGYGSAGMPLSCVTEPAWEADHASSASDPLRSSTVAGSVAASKRRSQLFFNGMPEAQSGRPTSRSRRKSLLPAGIVQAEARIHFLQQAYTFSMMANLPAILPATKTLETTSVLTPLGSQPELFDSSVEQSFSEAFTSLANSQGTDGWILEREPEPLLLDHGIFIPDFALTRGQRRIYMEILGFWTPSYRERKVQKLQRLRERNDLLLALPVEAHEAFASILPLFPHVVYNNQLSATDILQALQKHYDDFFQRLDSIDVVAVRAQVRREGLLPERECYELLHCFRRSELQQAAERIVGGDGTSEICFVAGVGLYANSWMERTRQSFLLWLARIHSTSLDEAIQAIRASDPLLQKCPAAIIETMLDLWTEVLLRRDSIFDTIVEEASKQDETGPAQPVDEVRIEPAGEPAKERKKSERERRTSPGKRPSSGLQVVQGDLWS